MAVEVKNLSINFLTQSHVVNAVKKVSFNLKKGEILGLVGESGSGKTVTGMSLARLIPTPPGEIKSGEIKFDNKNILSQTLEELYKIRGNKIGIIFQEPMTALSPLHKIGKQLNEAQIIHNKKLSKKEATKVSIEWLNKVGISEPEKRINDYPYQYSGGMRQRAMIAMALINNPEIIICDEPTTALDVSIQTKIFDLLLKLKQKNTSILFITHDMGVIWEICDRVMVMKDGKIIEKNLTEELFSNPKNKYTKQLLNSVPKISDQSLRENTEFNKNNIILKVENLSTWFPIRKGLLMKNHGFIKAVNNVSFKVSSGQIVGVVGESGSGKTTLGRSILSLDKISQGKIIYNDKTISNLSNKDFLPYRRDLQMIFQDPFSSLNPRLNILKSLTEGPIQHKIIKRDEKINIAKLYLQEVGLKEEYLYRYPHEFSGGQRQRICIAKSLAMKPKIIVCDECVSALDVTIQKQIILLLLKLNKKYRITFIFITHDISLVKKISDYLLVMKSGKVVEQGEPSKIINSPESTYTKKLINSIPDPGNLSKRKINLKI